MMPASKRKSVTDGMTNYEKLVSGVERQLLAFEETPCDAFPGVGPGVLVALPGKKGHAKYLFHIRDRLKLEGFKWNPEFKVWYLGVP